LAPSYVRAKLKIKWELTVSTDHPATIFKPMDQLTLEGTISHQCGITMNDSVEARCIAEVMESKPGIQVTYQPALIRIDGNKRIDFNMQEISEVLGREITPYTFEIATSTHYGLMVMIDEQTVSVFGDMDEARNYM
jgi:propane monooxygenase coupling protein